MLPHYHAPRWWHDSGHLKACVQPSGGSVGIVWYNACRSPSWPFDFFQPPCPPSGGLFLDNTLIGIHHHVYPLPATFGLVAS